MLIEPNIFSKPKMFAARATGLRKAIDGVLGFRLIMS
jgi:hypothetical protein